jgi:hypothetical protein
MTLHFTQIFFTDARTFISLLPFSAHPWMIADIFSFQPSALSHQLSLYKLSRHSAGQSLALPAMT